ncbi:MAG: glycosyltransferase family 4 protein, partial [Candidatus Binatia bacterium]
RELLAVPTAALRVVYPGCAEFFQPLDATAASAVLARLGLAPGYIMHLGTREPRKNLPRLVRAYARLGAAAPPLVLAGATGWGVDELPALLDGLGLRARVHLLGSVSTADLPALYSGAALFAYPSLYEGFGLPVLEAMACGTPVVSANVASLPEVAGDAALLVDPHDETALADAIGRVLREPALHADLRARGLARARTFTWQRCAAQTMAVYEEARRG